ncbi:MAG: NAD-glutamate dehydrogenase [Actinobacteria bacterium]|nr:NAD-glutamate dehydrogenase [Actinomycetota bacterium]
MIETTPVSAHSSAGEERLEELLARVHDAAPQERADLVHAFAQMALRRVPAGQLAAADPETTASQILAAFTFADERTPGDLAVRVFTPEVALDGWSDPGTVIEINVEDRPFLLSTVTEELHARGHDVVRMLHPIFGVVRGDDGRLEEVLPARTASTRESFLHLELDTVLDDETTDSLYDALREVLGDALAATGDYEQMRDRIEAAAAATRESAPRRYDPDEAAEAADLLEWLLEENFVLLGIREYEVTHGADGRTIHVIPGSGRGILRREETSTYAEPVAESEMESELAHRAFEGELLNISRTNRLSTVHRRTRMDYVGVKRVDEHGRVAGEFRIVGLFTRKAYAEPARDTPVLRRKLQRILEREDVVHGSHDEATLVSLFQALPKDELFQTDTDTLHRHLIELVTAEEHEETRVLVRQDAFTHTASILLAVPRDQYSPSLRRELQQLFVSRWQAQRVDVDLSLGDRAEAVARFTVHGIERTLDSVDIDQLQRDVRSRARSWIDEVTNHLVRRHGEADGRRLARQYADRVPMGYREVTPTDIAADDVRELAGLVRSGADLRVRAHHAANGDGLLRVKAYPAGAALELSGFLPILESLGLRVIEERPYQLDGDDPPLYIHDFGVRTDDGEPIHLERDGERLAEATLAARSGAIDVDALNRLVLRAELDWYEVTLLRAYRRYRRQLGTAYSTEYVNEAMNSHPAVARALLRLFAAKFDPDARADAETIAAARHEVLNRCDEVERLDHDRILRGFSSLIDATVRTNYYRRSTDASGHPFIVLKFDSSRIVDAPDPVPYREIFVYSPTLEGVHLRGGPVARGGLRWSDRMDDVRTEVLGLMKAQMLKNSVIVPTGAKGGFVVKRSPDHRDELRDVVRRQYETFVSALLEVTDNLVAGEIVPPARVRSHDGDDPYLVVAADRGTATYSDVANTVAARYGFWLDDAFASGGSHGYDHKVLGITARGAWIAVQRHFRELDIDVQTDPITVVGIGDMSGDVFGNGMLQSPAVQLVAAFDHRHVFLDPDPDPEASYQERRRLFEMPGSTWADYDPGLISPGGGVWARDLKSIPISDQVRDRLRIEDETRTPAELIQAILRAPVDLLWAGGIGTYVKASHQTHSQVGDRANEELRVNATEVRARVVAEGANLAFTQPARVQYARRGGRINMDAIDNSAGVDISDHEVNVKILLGVAIERGLIDRDERDRILEDITEEVVALVLRDNQLQTWRLSQEAAESPTAMDAYEAMLTGFEDRDVLDRDAESLPSTEEMQERRSAGAGLTRPELAVLMGYAKRDVMASVLRSSLPDDPALAPTLRGYFPSTLAERFDELIDDHRLRRELIATIVSNDIVNRMGVNFAFRVATEHGRGLDDVVAAYWVARDVSDAGATWQAIEDLDQLLGPSRAMSWKREVDKLIDSLTRIYLAETGVGVSTLVARDRPVFEALEGRMLELGTDAQRRHRIERMHELIDDLVDPDQAQRLACVRDLAMVPDISEVVRGIDEADPPEVADAFLRITAATHLDRLARRLDVFEPDDRWERWERSGLLHDLRELRSFAVAAALANERDLPASDAVERYLARRAERVAYARELIAQLADADPLRLDAAGVATRALRSALVG